MGGNVCVMDKFGERHEAEKIDLKKVLRFNLRHDFIDLFLALNHGFKEFHGTYLWVKDSGLRTGQVFNGSSSSFFNAGILDPDFIKVKRFVGDIDITVPSELKVPFWEYLNTVVGNELLPGITYIGNNVASPHNKKAQINALFKYCNGILCMNIQVDFEFVPYGGDGLPTSFAKFSHSSSWSDMTAGLKGVHHKYLLRALAGGSSQRKDVQVITKARGKPQSNPNGVQFNKFSVDRGLRINAYIPVMDGNIHRVVNGLPAYCAVDPKDSTYVTDVRLIAQHILNTDDLTQDEIDINMYSFTGILQLMKKYLTNSQIEVTLDRLLELYWAPGAQGFERDDPDLDLKIKSSGWRAAMHVFPFYKSRDINNVITAYYDNYRMTDINT